MMHSYILYAEHALRNPVPHSPSHWRASGILQYQLYGVKSPEQSPLATVSKYLPGILNHMCASIPSVMLLMPQVYSNSSAPLAWEVYDDRSDPGSKEASTDSTDHSSKDCMPCNSHRSFQSSFQPRIFAHCCIIPLHEMPPFTAKLCVTVLTASKHYPNSDVA